MRPRLGYAIKRICFVLGQFIIRIKKDEYADQL